MVYRVVSESGRLLKYNHNNNIGDTPNVNDDVDPTESD